MASTIVPPSSVSSPSDPAVLDRELLVQVARLGSPPARVAAAQALAVTLGAQGLLFFLRDTELGVLLPAPGFPQVLPGGDAWPAFLSGCIAAGTHAAELPFPQEGTVQRAAGYAVEGEAVLVLLGGHPRPEMIDLCRPLLPLLTAAFRGEQALQIAAAHAAAARETGAQARALAETLDAARRELQHALREAQEAEQRKDEFLAMLAHELRNPLAPIRTGLEVVRRLIGDAPAVQRPLTVISRQAEQLTRLVEDLLDVSRITQGKIDLRPVSVKLSAVVDQALESSRPLIEEHRHQLSVTLPEDVIWLEADSARLAQVLGNLLNNAAKYTEPGGRIGLEAARQGDEAVVRIRDTGVGIAPELLPRVFNLFEQGRTTLDRSHGGLGIGLTLVRRLVEMHGGSVSVSSEGPGRGSEFVVRLPLRPRGPGAGAVLSPPSSAAPATLRGRRILLVDDNADAAETLAAILSLSGHAIQFASNGQTALEIARTDPPEVVLLDIGLPGMDGYEVARRLRQSGAPAVLIALTGYGQASDRQRAREAGFDHHLVKPVDFDELERVLLPPD